MLKTFPEASKGYRLGWSGATYFSAASETHRVIQDTRQEAKKRATWPHCRREALVSRVKVLPMRASHYLGWLSDFSELGVKKKKGYISKR